MRERALNICERVQAKEESWKKKRRPRVTTSPASVMGGMSSSNVDASKGQRDRSSGNIRVQVTEHMVQSVVRACVKAVRRHRSDPSWTAADRSRPLDAARTVLEELESRHGLALETKLVNLLAAACQLIGGRDDACTLLDSCLKDRIIGPEPEDGHEVLNVNNLGAKYKASYAIRVQGAVTKEDWGLAVDHLTTMTEAGLYPAQRHLQAWIEISERKT